MALSLLLHLLLLLLLTANLKEIHYLPPQKEQKKITLNLKEIVTTPPAAKPKAPATPSVPQKPVLPPKTTPKPQPLPPKITKVDTSGKTFATQSQEENNISKQISKPTKKVVKKRVPTTKKSKKVVKRPQKPKKHISRKKPTRSKDPLANMLMNTGTQMLPTRASSDSKAGTYGERIIQKLYGREFKTYSPTQKEYIRNNLSTIHKITQHTLIRNGYPTIAIQTRQQGTNVVSFYLHPNGDISNLKLKTRIGYAALDENTIKVIKLAYKDYPLPNQKTKIIFYVRYSIY